MIALRLVGDAAAVARLGGFADRVQRRLRATLIGLGGDLQAAAVANASGIALAVRSGKLARSITARVDDGAAPLAVAVGFDRATVPYGAIQEFGGTTRAHLIAAKEAKALAFSFGGQLAFAKHVNHPGSHIPAHSFLGAALAALAPQALAQMHDAVAGETAP